MVSMLLQHVLSHAPSPPLCHDGLGAGVLLVGLDVVAAPAAAGAAAAVAGHLLLVALFLAGSAVGLWEVRSPQFQ